MATAARIYHNGTQHTSHATVMADPRQNTGQNYNSGKKKQSIHKTLVSVMGKFPGTNHKNKSVEDITEVETHIDGTQSNIEHRPKRGFRGGASALVELFQQGNADGPGNVGTGVNSVGASYGEQGVSGGTRNSTETTHIVPAVDRTSSTTADNRVAAVKTPTNTGVTSSQTATGTLKIQNHPSSTEGASTPKSSSGNASKSSEGNTVMPKSPPPSSVKSMEASTVVAVDTNDGDAAVDNMSDLDIDSMNTLREFESVIEKIASQTDLSGGWGAQDTKAFANPSIHHVGEGTRGRGESRGSHIGQKHSSKSPPPVAPKRSHKQQNNGPRSPKSPQPASQQTSDHQPEISQDLSRQDQENETSTTGGHTSPKAPTRNLKASGVSISPPGKLNTRRPMSELVWAQPGSPLSVPSENYDNGCSSPGVPQNQSTPKPSSSAPSEPISSSSSVPAQAQPSQDEARKNSTSGQASTTSASSSPLKTSPKSEKQTTATSQQLATPRGVSTLPPTSPTQPSPNSFSSTPSTKVYPNIYPQLSQDLSATTPTPAKVQAAVAASRTPEGPQAAVKAPRTAELSQAAVTASPRTPEMQEDDEELCCYNHRERPPQRYCNDHNQAICLECAFELHRSCRDVEVLEAAARGRRDELEKLCEGMLMLKAEWECVLSEVERHQGKLDEEKAKTLTAIEKMTEDAIKAIRIKGTQLREEAVSLYANEGASSVAREERVRRALTSLQDVQLQADQVLGSGGTAGLLRQFGKLKGRCEALVETDVIEANEVMDCVKVTSTWFDDAKLLPPAKLTLETRPAVSKKNMQLSERGLETFRRIAKKKRQNLLPETYRDERVTSPVYRSAGARASRMSLARSVASTGSIPSVLSAQSMGFLDGPQSIFEFFAGLESDKFPFGLGDICVMQPRLTILITYLTSDLLRVFPWRQESSSFVSEPMGCTLCCISQLSNETVAVTSSNSDQLSIFKVDSESIHVTHTVSMKRQYRAVTSLDYRTLALATDSKKSAHNVIVIVRFDSSDYRSFTQLKTINARQGSVPMIKFLSKTLFKVPYSMCTSSNGHIIVSDSENKALLALQQSGDKRFVFQPPKQSGVIDTPGGVACSPAGYLYLVDSCEQRILRFDRGGKFRKVVLSQEDGLEWPIGVACADESTLVVAEFYGQVKVFRVR
ncbi:serine-rich adhesin for platelets-like [Littorina saxatilis]|uniref:B box-type domain-containing protein n=1 Tax=Littorina saxatilis TaxID=31220 RepID=A0AAN9GGH8_9CAEN